MHTWFSLSMLYICVSPSVTCSAIYTDFQEWSCCKIRFTFKEESNFPASALKKAVFPDPGAPRTSVILVRTGERTRCYQFRHNPHQCLPVQKYFLLCAILMFKHSVYYIWKEILIVDHVIIPGWSYCSTHFIYYLECSFSRCTRVHRIYYSLHKKIAFSFAHTHMFLNAPVIN